jgi:cell division protein FtsB
MTRRNRSRQALQRRRRTSLRIGFVVGGLLLAMLAISFFFADMGLRNYAGMMKHAKQLEREIRELERINADLRKDMYRIQHDPIRIEELARERLGLVKKGETVYQIVQEPESLQ